MYLVVNSKAAETVEQETCTLLSTGHLFLDRRVIKMNRITVTINLNYTSILSSRCVTIMHHLNTVSGGWIKRTRDRQRGT